MVNNVADLVIHQLLIQRGKTAPLQAVPNITSKCSAQFHIKLPTRSSLVIPNSS